MITSSVAASPAAEGGRFENSADNKLLSGSTTPNPSNPISSQSSTVFSITDWPKGLHLNPLFPQTNIFCLFSSKIFFATSCSHTAGLKNLPRSASGYSSLFLRGFGFFPDLGGQRQQQISFWDENF